MQLPDAFLRKVCVEAGFELPALGVYGVGMVFLSPDAERRVHVKGASRRSSVREGQRVLGWRTVPTDDSTLGNTARAGEPVVRQVFIGRVAAPI